MTQVLSQIRRFLASPAGEVLVLAVLMAAATALRLHRLGHENLWGDEYYTWLIGSFPTMGEVLAKVVEDEPHPPLLFVMYHHVVRWLPEGDFWLRLPAALAGVVAMPLLHAALRPWGRRLALVAVALLVVSPMHVWYSQEARAGAFKVALELVVVLAVAWSLRAPDGGRRLLAGMGAAAACAVGLQLHFFFVFIGSAALAVLAAEAWGRRDFSGRALLPPALLFVLLAGTTVRALSSWGLASAWMPERYGPDLLLDVVRAQAQGPLWSPLPVGLSLAGMALWVVLLGAGVAAWWNRDRRLALVLGSFLFFCLVLPVLISFVRPLVWHGQRHLVIATPFVAAALAAAVLRWRLLWIALVPVLALQLVYLDGMYRHRQKHHYGGALRLVEEQGGAGDPLIVVPSRLRGLAERYAEVERPFLGADSAQEAAALGRSLPRPFWVLAFDDARPAMAEEFPGARLDAGLVETHRPGQELFVIRVN